MMSLSFISFIDDSEVSLCVDGSVGDVEKDEEPTTNRVTTNTDLSTMIYELFFVQQENEQLPNQLS